MSFKSLNRRTLLRGMLATGAGVAIPLPLLESMLNGNGTALAQTDSALSPVYVTWFFGNGSLPGLWKPAVTGSGSAWSLSSQLEPLADVKSHLTVVSGLVGKLVAAGLEHPTGSAAATTGGTLDGNAVRLPSIDQIVADLIDDGMPFRSLEVGVTPATPNGNQHSLHSVSHNGPNARNNPEFDPQKVFDRLFAGGAQVPTDDGAAAEQAARLALARTSVLDAIQADGVNLQARLSIADRERVEQHLESIRTIERRLESMDPAQAPAACSSIVAPTVGADTQSEAPPEVNTAMAELMTLALSCELTRVGTFTFSLPAAHVYYRHLAEDMNADFHDVVCHLDPGTESDQPRVHTGVLYAMRCLNEFLTKLQATPHGATNLLDAALVYVTSDTAWGKIHKPDEWPVLFAGKAGGRLRGDEHHNFPGENLSAALLTIAQLMGSTATEFGMDNGYVNSALAGIQV